MKFIKLYMYLPEDCTIVIILQAYPQRLKWWIITRVMWQVPT